MSSCATGSRGTHPFSFNSVIAYSVIVGVLMASGKEVAGKIPKGKVGSGPGAEPGWGLCSPESDRVPHGEPPLHV